VIVKVLGLTRFTAATGIIGHAGDEDRRRSIKKARFEMRANTKIQTSPETRAACCLKRRHSEKFVPRVV